VAKLHFSLPFLQSLQAVIRNLAVSVTPGGTTQTTRQGRGLRILAQRTQLLKPKDLTGAKRSSSEIGTVLGDLGARLRTGDFEAGVCEEAGDPGEICTGGGSGEPVETEETEGT
jgi:hypothetical protein